MRTLITCSALAVFILSITVPTEAQLLNRLKKKAQNTAEKKAEEKLAAEVEKRAEQMVEDSWNTIFGDLEENSKEGRNPMFNLNSNVTTEEIYRFDIVTTMEIETIDKDGKSEPPMTMKMHFNQDEMYTGTRYESEEMQKEKRDVFIIYDFKNSAMVMLMNSEDEKFSFAYDWQQALEQIEEVEEENEMEEEQEVDWDEVEEWNGYTRIGTKNIAGYSCDGYRSESDQSVTEVWITREADFGMQNMFQANTNAKQLRGKVPADYPYGMMIAMESENLESGEKLIMKVTDIEKNANVAYSMSDYPTMSIGNKDKN